MNYFEEENELSRKLFNIEDIIEFQKEHDIQVIRGSDYQYSLYIDKNAYGSSLTPLFAMVSGIKLYKEHKAKSKV